MTIPSNVASCKLNVASPLRVYVLNVSVFHMNVIESANVHSTVRWNACALLLFAAFCVWLPYALNVSVFHMRVIESASALLLFAAFCEACPIHLMQKSSHAEPTETVTFGRCIYKTIIYVYQTSMGLIGYCNEKLGLVGIIKLNASFSTYLTACVCHASLWRPLFPLPQVSSFLPLPPWWHCGLPP